MSIVQLDTPFTAGDIPLSEYPRPQMVRDSYMCLNGTWQYAITDSEVRPAEMQGDILVPFSPESALSGVGKNVAPHQYLHYRRIVTMKKHFAKDILLLHFGAVDMIATIYVNGIRAGSHMGGYNAFTVDITKHVHDEAFLLEVTVQDPTDTSSVGYCNGKQSTKRGGIWYTPQSGIWQTVWLESVPSQYIAGVKITPLYDRSAVQLDLDKVNCDRITAIILDGDKEIARLDSKDDRMIIDMPVDFISWTPENPHLYNIQLISRRDMVMCYFAMRSFGLAKDKKGYLRTTLNGKPYFHNGLLDQGYWPDGLYTAPSDEALEYDVKLAKELGFNMLRKHIKVEPMRWYYHCDRLGMLVWQDMPSGGTAQKKWYTIALPMMGYRTHNDKHSRHFSRVNSIGKQIHIAQYSEMIEQLYNCPCICTWVPFNEGWGQFNALTVEKLTKQMDSTRLVDHASGWHDQGGGDFASYHVYFRKVRLPRSKKRAKAVTEFGGYSYVVDGHVFNSDKLFGYKKFSTAHEYMDSLIELYNRDIISNIRKGLTCAIYTQLADVEDECNGLVTYDRHIVKVDKYQMRSMNSRVKL